MPPIVRTKVIMASTCRTSQRQRSILEGAENDSQENKPCSSSIWKVELNLWGFLLVLVKRSETPKLAIGTSQHPEQ